MIIFHDQELPLGISPSSLFITPLNKNYSFKGNIQLDIAFMSGNNKRQIFINFDLPHKEKESVILFLELFQIKLAHFFASLPKIDNAYVDEYSIITQKEEIRSGLVLYEDIILCKFNVPKKRSVSCPWYQVSGEINSELITEDNYNKIVNIFHEMLNDWYNKIYAHEL